MLICRTAALAGLSWGPVSSLQTRCQYRRYNFVDREILGFPPFSYNDEEHRGVNCVPWSSNQVTFTSLVPLSTRDQVRLEAQLCGVHP